MGAMGAGIFYRSQNSWNRMMATLAVEPIGDPLLIRNRFSGGTGTRPLALV